MPSTKTSAPVQSKITVRDLNFYYGKFHALKSINLDIPEKKVTAFIGPSGCGKSTLLRTFNRMFELYPEQRAEGQIILDGENLLTSKQDVALIRAKVGMVFQKPTPFPMSIYDNIAFGVKLFESLSASDMDDRVEWALRKAALWNEVKDKLDQSGAGLSGGQQQRLCIARGIAIKPEVLLLDEPCSALDPISTAKIEELIAELKKLGYDPVNGGELTPAVADIVAKLGEIQVEEGAKTLADIEGRMKQDVPALSNDEIHRAFAGKIAEEAEPKKAVKARIAEFKKQAGLWADIHAILESGELEQKGDKPVSSEKVQQLREILAKLRLGLLKTEMDDAKFEAAQKKLTEIQDQLALGVRSIPDRKAKPEQSEAVKKVEAEIRRLEKVMSIEDSIFDLEAKLQRKGPPTEKRRVEEDDQLFMLHRKRLELRRRLARIEEAERPLTAWRAIGNTAEFMRATKATADFSAMFRQAVVLAPMRPVKFTKAAAKAMKAFFDSEYADRLDFEMRRQPQHIWRERAGLFLSNVDAKMTGREEAFTSSLAERLPGLGAVVRGSNRHMVTMLNQMRVAAFDSFREANPDASAEVMNAMARYVNVATGRGDLRQLEPVAGFLAKLAFSPRFVASRIQMLGSPLYFAAKYKDKRVAKVAAKDMLAFTAAGMSILTLAHLAGVEVGLDPEDSFFGKLRFGKTTIDLWGGLQQPVALLAKAMVKVGDRAGIVEANKDINVLDAGIRFLTYKASPGISGTYGIAFGEDIIGREVGLTEALLKSVAPMTLETAYEAWHESEGGLAETLVTTAASASGVGVQVYEDKKKRKAKLRKVD